MRKSNVNPCHHPQAHIHTIRTSDGRTVIMCEYCHAALLARLADPETIRVMIKSTMPAAEVRKMRYERENMRIEARLAEEIALAHALAGFPQFPMITEFAGVV